MPEPLPNLAEYIEGAPPPADLPIPRAPIFVQAGGEEWGRLRPAVPDDFAEHVYAALEYTMRHQGLEPDECCRRRTMTREWMDQLREPGRYNEWLERTNLAAGALLREENGQDAERRAAREAERAAAEARADALLRGRLNPRQRKEYAKKGYFHVVVGERRFRITKGRSHNIKEVDAKSRIRRTFCAHPIPSVPHADTMLAQKLMLEVEPDVFFKMANTMLHWSPTQGRRRVEAARRRIDRRTVLDAQRCREALDRVPVAEEGAYAYGWGCGGDEYQRRILEGYEEAAARFDDNRRAAAERIRQLQQETDIMAAAAARGEEYFVEPLVGPITFQMHQDDMAVAAQRVRDQQNEMTILRRLTETALDEAAGRIPDGVCQAIDEIQENAEATARGVEERDERAA